MNIYKLLFFLNVVFVINIHGVSLMETVNNRAL